MLLGFLFLFLINSVTQLLVEATQLCSLEPENELSSLSCPANQVVTSVDFAMFGTFANNSACPNPSVTTQCPTPVLAQVELLCLGNRTCNIACACDALSSPACTCFSQQVSTGVPAFPCNGIPKQLAVKISCGMFVPENFLMSNTATFLNGDLVKTVPSLRDLRMAFLESPVLGMDKLTPHFSWSLDSGVQSAYQVDICATSRLASCTQIWSSGKILNSNPMHVTTLPLPLSSDKEYMWTINVWDKDFSSTNSSGTFITGLLNSSDWGDAEWIDAGACTESSDLTTVGNCSGGLLRTEFDVNSTALSLGRVSLFLSACQYYELYIDGNRVGTNELDVAWTRFNRMRAYVTYNLSVDLFKVGKHAIGLFVGQGFCGEEQSGPQSIGGRRAGILSLRLHAASDDAILQMVSTNSKDMWLSGNSPLVWESA